MKKTITILFIGVLLSCNNEEKVADSILNKIETTAKEKAEIDTDFSPPSQAAPNNATFKMNFGGELILDKEDLFASVTFTKKSITVELTQDKNKILLGMKGEEIFNQKPLSGVFSPSSTGNEKMAFMRLSVLEEGSDQNFRKMPIVFEGDFKIIKLTQGELIAEISGKGSILEEISVPEKWKPITAKIICKNPRLTAISVEKEKLFY